MRLPLRVPKSVGLRQKIVEKYTFLYKEYRKFYPERKDYTYQQLRNNISQVASIVNSEIESSDVHTSTFIPWLDNDWKQFYYKHWYFAITIEDLSGTLTAVVQDAHYEGDHHNDTLLSKPYDIEDLQYKKLY